ncbi:MAG: DoxX family membrane protein [bacterium]|nr:DoxX family membrane protein [bacterium]
MAHYSIKLSRFSYLFLADTRSSIFWLLVRVYVGYEWFMAGFDKAQNSSWVGLSAGSPIIGFVNGALQKTAGAHPDVQMWYATFLQNFVLTHPTFWTNAVAYGEVLVGLGLIVGCVVGVAAFFGVLMNVNYLLAGTVSVNPTLLILGIFLILGRRVAGHLGLDYYVRPWLHKSST